MYTRPSGLGKRALGAARPACPGAHERRLGGTARDHHRDRRVRQPGGAGRGGRRGRGDDRPAARPASTPSSSPRSGTHPSPSTAIATASGTAELGVLVLARQGGVELPPPGVWTIDPAHSKVAATAQHLGLSSVQGRFAAFPRPDRDRRDRRDVPCRGRDRRGVDRHRQRHARRPPALGRLPRRRSRIRRSPTGASGCPSRVRTGGRCAETSTMSGITRAVDLDLTYLGTSPDPWGGLRAAFRADHRAAPRAFRDELQPGGAGGDLPDRSHLEGRTRHPGGPGGTPAVVLTVHDGQPRESTRRRPATPDRKGGS